MTIGNTFISAFNWYGFLIGSAMLLSIVCCYFLSIKRGYYADMVFDVAIFCIPLAIVGARLFYVIFDIIGGGASYTFKEVLGIGSGGLAGLSIFGGLLGAISGAFILILVKRKKPANERVNFFQIADLCFIFIMLSQAIGRWGNFANGEAHGPAVVGDGILSHFPFSVNIDGTRYLATFFYESMFNLVGSMFLLWLYIGKRKSFDGFVFACYLIIYGSVRTWIETMRTDALMAGSVKVSQLMAILFLVLGIIIIIQHFYFAKVNEKKPFVFVRDELLSEEYYGYEKSILHHPNKHLTRAEKREQKLQELENMSNYSDDFYNVEDDTMQKELENQEKLDNILAEVEGQIATGELSIDDKNEKE